MDELFFKLSFAVLWIVYILIRVPHDKAYKQSEMISMADTKRDKRLLVLLLAGLLILPMMWILTPFVDIFYLDFPLSLRFAGLVLAILSLIYFARIHKALGVNWSPSLEMRHDHELIKIGPYKRIRHPMYLQIWIWAIAQIFILSNAVAGFSGIVAWAVVYWIRVAKEEKMMLEKFGSGYADYMKQTGRIWPVMNRKKTGMI